MTGMLLILKYVLYIYNFMVLCLFSECT